MKTKSTIEGYLNREGENMRSFSAGGILRYSSAITFLLPLVAQYPDLRQKLEAVGNPWHSQDDQTVKELEMTRRPRHSRRATGQESSAELVEKHPVLPAQNPT
jgi:hypothetical protein